MATYLVSYDLMKQKDYKTLIDNLKALGAKKILASVWTLTHANSSAKTLRDYLKQYIDLDDRLLVVRYDDWATVRTLDNPH